MKDIDYFFARLKYKVTHDDRCFVSLFRKCGMIIGDNCHIFSNILSPESYLISIGSNTTISNDVQFVTHDNSICKISPQHTDVFGKINIGKNCFIGAHSIILCGCTIADNTIIAAGSVVTKSVCENRLVIGGNPAKIIGTWDGIKERNGEKFYNVDSLSYEEKKRLLLSKEDKLVARQGMKK